MDVVFALIYIKTDTFCKKNVQNDRKVMRNY